MKAKLNKSEEEGLLRANIHAIEAEEASATPVYKLIRQKLRLTSEKTNLSSGSTFSIFMRQGRW